MPLYSFICPDPDCGVTAEATNPRAVLRCSLELHENPPVMRRLYTAPALTSTAVPTRYSKGPHS